MAIGVDRTLAKSGFQIDHVCVVAEPFSNHQEGYDVDLDYIAIKLWSETVISRSHQWLK